MVSTSSRLDVNKNTHFLSPPRLKLRWKFRPQAEKVAIPSSPLRSVLSLVEKNGCSEWLPKAEGKLRIATSVLTYRDFFLTGPTTAPRGSHDADYVSLGAEQEGKVWRWCVSKFHAPSLARSSQRQLWEGFVNSDRAVLGFHVNVGVIRWPWSLSEPFVRRCPVVWGFYKLI